MLAPRILHFSRQQLFWDCPLMSACESLPAGLPHPLDGSAGLDRHWRGRLQEMGTLRERPLAGASDISLELFWRTAVRKYTACNLTMGRDKTIAMWGIAKLMRDAFDEEYAAGLWDYNLEEQLAWRVADCTLEERPSESRNETKARQMPSWSWASMDGPIELQDRMAEKRVYVVKDHNDRALAFDLKQKRPKPQTGTLRKGSTNLQKRMEDMRSPTSGKRTAEPQVEIQQINLDEEPELRSQSIAMQGHVGVAKLQQEPIEKRWFLELPGLVLEHIEAFPDIKPQGKSDYEHPFFVALSATMDEDLDMYTGCGLLLQPVGKRHYHRIGSLHFRNISSAAWKAMLTTHGMEDFTGDEYDARGLKFWLD